MVRSVPFVRRFQTVVILALLLVLGAIAFVFAQQQQPIPVTSAASARSNVTSHETIYLGGGYSLEMEGQAGHIVAPEPLPLVKGSSAPYTVDLGAGYMLEMNNEGGRVVPPTSLVKPQTSQQKAPVPEVRKIYIGDGRWLVPGPNGAKIIP